MTDDSMAQMTSLLHAGRMHELGEVLSTLMHELAQPMTVIAHNSTLLLKHGGSQPGLRDVRVAQSANAIANAAAVCSELILRVRQFSKAVPSDEKPQLLPESVDYALSLTTGLLEMREVSVRKEYEEVPPLSCDRVKIAQVVVNL